MKQSRFILLGLLLCAASASAFAQVSIDVGAGITRAQPRSNGTWYQQGFPHTLRLTSRAVELDLRWQVTDKTSLTAGVVELGRYSSDSLDTPRDANYSGNAAAPCVGPCLPLAHYMGHGGVRGLQLLAGRRAGDDWRLEMQGGVLVYQTQWALDVPDWYPPDGPITPVHTHDQRWATGTVVGFRLSRRGSPWHGSVRYYSDGVSFGGHVGSWPPIWRNTVVAMVGWSSPHDRE